jgi:large subunit ribosomal protein L26e
MKSPLTSALKKTHGINTKQVQKGDMVSVVRGMFRGRTGRITTVSRNKWVVNIEGVKIEKVNGHTVPVGIDPSKCIITKLAQALTPDLSTKKKQK